MFTRENLPSVPRRNRGSQSHHNCSSSGVPDGWPGKRRVRMERGAAHDITGIEQPTAQSGQPRAGHGTGWRPNGSVARAGIPALLYVARRRPVRRGHLGAAVGRHRQRARRGGVRAARRRNPFVLVAAGDQHRRLEVFPRADRHARAREQRQAADRPRGEHDYRVGRARTATSRRKPISRASAPS